MIVEVSRFGEGYVWRIMDADEASQFEGTAIGVNEQTGKSLHFALLYGKKGYFWLTWNASLRVWMKPKERPFVQSTSKVCDQIRQEHPELRFTFFVTLHDSKGRWGYWSRKEMSQLRMPDDWLCPV